MNEEGFYKIKDIVENQLIKNYDGTGLSYWQVRALFKKEKLPNYNKFRDERGVFVTKGKDIINFNKENYGE